MAQHNNHNRAKTEQFLQLFSQHQQAIRAYIGALAPSKSDGDDIMQETSLALWNKWDRYDQSRGFMQWACGVARLEVLRQRRRVATGKLWFNEKVLDLLAVDYEQNLGLIGDRLEALPNCLDRLSEKDRYYISMRYREGGSTKDLVAATGRPESTVYRSLGIIREQLRRCVDSFVSSGSYPETT